MGTPAAAALTLPFHNTYARLPERMYARVAPTPAPAPSLVELNEPLARALGLDPEALRTAEGVEILAGSRVAGGSEPLAMAYAGHQFGNWVQQLGDGRANLLGEIAGYDVQLKGSGRTPFSRGGDGRAAIGPVLREYLLSESMHTLGVPTTRSLAAVRTGEWVWREQRLPGAVLTRVASSHLRVGTFQYFAARGDLDALRALAFYAMDRHYPQARGAAKPFGALLAGVITRQAQLVARWMLLGFIHGVMNTDNCSVAGETIDYGPCAWMEAYNPMQVYSSIDLRGRYAYTNQPPIALWNLTRLAEALLALLAEEEGSVDRAVESAQASLEAFRPQYDEAWLAGMRAKLGLHTEQQGDRALAEALLAAMHEGHADFSLTFRRLPEGVAARALFADAEPFDRWAESWRARLAREGATPASRTASMHAVNPVYIPRNHLVEAALAAAAEHQDDTPFRELLAVCAQPFVERPELALYATPARPEQCVTQTFCGT